MAVQLNHTIVHAHDKAVSAAFLSEDPSENLLEIITRPYGSEP